MVRHLCGQEKGNFTATLKVMMAHGAVEATENNVPPDNGLADAHRTHPEEPAITVQELADKVLETRKRSFAEDRSQTAIVATEQLGPQDMAFVRRVVADAGYTGAEADAMVRQVSARVVGRVEALADHLPCGAGD